MKLYDDPNGQALSTDPAKANAYVSDADKLREELRGIAIELHQRLALYGKFGEPTGWKPSSTSRGLVSQIETMTAAILERLQRTESALGWVLSPFVTGSTPEAELRKRVQFANEDYDRMGVKRP